MTRILLTALMIVPFAQVASANVIVFTDKAAWQAAVGPSTITQANFNSPEIDPIPEGVLTDVGGLNVIYESADDSTNTANALDRTNNNRLQLRVDRLGTNTTDSLMLTFNSPVGSFGADFETVDQGDNLSILVNGDTINIDDVLGAGIEDGFVGFIASQQFSSLSFDATGDVIFRMNNAFFSPVPEPSTLAGLATLGLFGVCITRRQRRRA